MLALYRAGRPADALETYQRGRRLMVDELGLEPGETLRQLEARILQQDPELDAPIAWPQSAEMAPRPPPSRHRRLALAGVAALILSAAVTAAILTADRGQGRAAAPLRVALVVEASRNPSDWSPQVVDQVNALDAAAQNSAVEARILSGGYQSSGFLRSVARAARTYDLVIVGSTSNRGELSKLTRRFPDTRFLVLDSVFGRPSSFTGQRNVTGIKYDDYENGYLGGYLASLMTHGKEAISAIAGGHAQPVPDLVNGFKAGARRARPATHVLINYTNTYVNETVCAEIANRQIDHGSRVVFDIAGECGLGALQAADIDGAWVLGADSDLSNYGPQVLGSVVDRIDIVAKRAVTLFASGHLPGGQDLQLNLASGSIGLVGISSQVPQAVRSRVAGLIAKLLARDQAHNPRYQSRG
jgi:basic membrane protein A